MSYVVSVRRAEGQSSFSSEELERFADAHEGFAFERGVLKWGNGSSALDLFVEGSELRTDSIHFDPTGQALDALRVVARELNARLVGEEGEDLTIAELAGQSPASRWQVALGALLTVLALPFMLLVLLVRLPWLLWKLSRGIK